MLLLKSIADHRPVAEILRNLYAHILAFGGERDDGAGFDLGASSAEFDLFLFMLLTNRPELAKLFWVRDGELRVFSLLQSAGFGAFFCRQVGIADDLARAPSPPPPLPAPHRW